MSNEAKPPKIDIQCKLQAYRNQNEIIQQKEGIFNEKVLTTH